MIWFTCVLLGFIFYFGKAKFIYSKNFLLCIPGLIYFRLNLLTDSYVSREDFFCHTGFSFQWAVR